MTDTVCATVPVQSQSLVSLNEIGGKKILCTTSLRISEVFEKDHDNVLRDIRNLTGSNKFSLLNFEESTYVNDRNKTYKIYLLDKKISSILIMGFTGEKALDWQIAYADEFDRMEKELNNRPKYVQRTRYDLPAESNEILNFIMTKVRDGIGKSTRSTNFMAMAGIVNDIAFGEVGRGKNLRQNMTLDQYQNLNRTITAVTKAILMGHIHKKEIIEFLVENKLIETKTVCVNTLSDSKRFNHGQI